MKPYATKVEKVSQVLSFKKSQYYFIRVFETVNLKVELLEKHEILGSISKWTVGSLVKTKIDNNLRFLTDFRELSMRIKSKVHTISMIQEVRFFSKCLCLPFIGFDHHILSQCSYSFIKYLCCFYLLGGVKVC